MWLEFDEDGSMSGCVGLGRLERWVLGNGFAAPVKTCDQDVVLLAIGRTKLHA